MKKQVKGIIKKKELPQPNMVDLSSVKVLGDMMNNLSELRDEVVQTMEDKCEKVEHVLENIVDIKTKEMDEKIDAALAEFEDTAVGLIKDIKSLDTIKGDAGKDADEENLEKRITAKIPSIPDVIAQIPKLDENALFSKFIKRMPEAKADLKVIQEHFETDPMDVIKKIMEMPKGKFKFKMDHVDGLEQTMSTFRNQLGRGYLHGGGDTVVAGSGITVTTNSNGQKVIAATGSGGSVTSVSVVTTNGVSGSVATATTTPAITLTLGAITPTSVNSVVISGASTPTLSVTGTTTVSGANTGDQNIFASIPVSGQTTITTVSPTQALTFVAGSNMTITTDNTAKTITFASSGGASGATTALDNLAAVAINAALLPGTSDSIALGSATKMWSDLFLGDGALINFNNGNAVITHSSGILTVSTGDLRVTTAGTNAASAVTVGSTQTLTNKTLTAPTIGTSMTGSYLTASEILITDGSKNLVSAAVATYPSLTELSYVKGVTSTIQTQLNARLPLAGGIISGDITLGENTSIALDSVLSADGKYSGTTIAGTAGTTLAFGDLVYLAAADSRWELVDADSVTTAGAVWTGICVLAAAADGSPTVILLNGNIRADANFPALTVGAPVYASTTPGDIQVAQPNGTDDVIHVVGFAMTVDSIYFNPSSDYITHT